MSEFTDMAAREMAADAHNQIVAHEGICAERWRAQHVAMTDLKRSIELQTRQMWAANAIVMTALLGAIAWLANHAFP